LKSIIIDKIRVTGGWDSIISWKEEVNTSGERVFSSPVDSNSLLSYEQALQYGSKIIGFDLYADGTTLSSSGSQSACTLRFRLSNILGKSSNWHEVGIAPIVSENSNISPQRLSKLRTSVFQRFLFLVLKDIIDSSSDGLDIDGRKAFPRLISIVADQKQERVFFALKSAGSFMDCTLCTMTSRIQAQERNEDESEEERISTPVDAVYKIQMEAVNSPGRDVQKTVWYQLVLSTRNYNLNLFSHMYNDSVISEARTYLNRHSASEHPPALAAIHGLGTNPFKLYSRIALDRIIASTSAQYAIFQISLSTYSVPKTITKRNIRKLI